MQCQRYPGPEAVTTGPSEESLTWTKLPSGNSLTQEPGVSICYFTMKLRVPRHLRNRHLLILDDVLLGVSTLLAYVVRFEGLDWGPANLYTALVYLAVSLPLKLGVLLYVGLYRRLWRFAGVAELEHILVATGAYPFVPAFEGADLAITSNEMFHLDALPRRIVIVGGGFGGVAAARPRPRATIPSTWERSPSAATSPTP